MSSTALSGLYSSRVFLFLSRFRIDTQRYVIHTHIHTQKHTRRITTTSVSWHIKRKQHLDQSRDNNKFTYKFQKGDWRGRIGSTIGTFVYICRRNTRHEGWNNHMCVCALRVWKSGIQPDRYTKGSSKIKDDKKCRWHNAKALEHWQYQFFFLERM